MYAASIPGAGEIWTEVLPKTTLNMKMIHAFDEPLNYILRPPRVDLDRCLLKILNTLVPPSGFSTSEAMIVCSRSQRYGAKTFAGSIRDSAVPPSDRQNRH